MRSKVLRKLLVFLWNNLQAAVIKMMFHEDMYLLKYFNLDLRNTEVINWSTILTYLEYNNVEGDS